MTAVHTTGSYIEPIVVSDEEDAAFVENELSRWTDSSNSSSNSPTYSPTQNAYSPPYFALPPSRPKSPVPPVSAPSPVIAPSNSGQKRKWTDMRDPSSSSNTIPHSHPANDHHSAPKKKKKQRKERQRNAPAPSSSTSESHKSAQRKARSIPTFQEGSSGQQSFDYPTPPYNLQIPYDYQGFEQGFGMAYGMGMGWPVAPFQMVSPTFLSPEDEYRPTDGPLWNPSEHPSALSALAPAWYPPSATSHYLEPEPSLPSGLSARASPPPAESDPPAQTSPPTFISQPPPPPSEPPPADFSTLFQQPFDSSLSERLRQLEALSASLMALAGGSSTLQGPAESPVRASFSIPSPQANSRQELPPVQKRPESPPVRKLPEPPVRPPTEPLKRLIGVPEDKGNNGYFDLRAQHLDPPAPSAPIPPVADFTLVMAQLPKRFRKTDFVTSWAKRYGTPVRVVLDPKAGKALVEWVGSQAVEHAFIGPRLRGDGKEHIRVYRYRGAKPPPPTVAPSEQAPQVKMEVEDGEIEEGEVVETESKSKKKKNKGKKKQPAAPPVPVPVPLVHSFPPPPHLPTPASPALVASSSAIPIVPPVAPVAPEPRRSLEERFSDPPPAPVVRESTGEEEEMELESDDEAAHPLPVAPSVVADQTSQEEDMDLEDDEDDPSAQDADVEDTDVDMEMSSVAEGTPPPVFKVESSPPPAVDPAGPLPAPRDLDPMPDTALQPPTVVPHLSEQEEVAVRDARRQKLEDAIARTKAELAMRAAATSSRISLVSSTGTSESPEPVTPLDSPVWEHAQVAVATGSHTEVVVSENNRQSLDVTTPPVVIKTEATTVNLDDLASSFITETIHAAATAPQTPSPPSPTSTASMLPHQIPLERTVPITVAVPIPKPAPVPTTMMVTIPLSEEQKQQKQKRWLELVSASKSLFGKIAAAKTKEEKDLLMRLLRAKTKAADEVKREIDSGVVVVEVNDPVPAPAPSPTPTPVPSSRMSSATPTPTSNTPVPGASATVLQKRKASPSAPVRWPETAREIIIIVSDDEAD